MKNNVLGALVVFFAVVACLLILDDLTSSYTKDQSEKQEIKKFNQEKQEELATTDLQQ